MPNKRSSHGKTSERKRPSLERSQKQQSSDDDSDEDPSTQFLENKEDTIKDCLMFLLAHNSTLLPVKRNDIIKKFGEKIKRGDRLAIFKAIKARLKTIGVLLKDVDNSRFILVNVFPKYLISVDPTPERQFLCLILALILFNRGYLMKVELENCLIKLGIHLQTCHPYFGDLNKTILLFEKQCYLKKSIVENTLLYEWGVRANCEVEKDDICNTFEEILGVNGNNLPQIDLNTLTPPEDDFQSDQEHDDDN